MAEFGFDPKKAVRHLRTADPALAAVIGQIGPFGMELKSSRSLFGALAEAIVYQQLNGRAAATIFARLRALFPEAEEGPTTDQILGASDEKLAEFIVKVVEKKEERHHIGEPGFVPASRTMVHIGG